MTQEKALAVLSPREVQQERLALLVVFGDDEGDGEGLSVAEAARVLGISYDTAKSWWRTQFVQDKVREYLDVVRREVQLRALKSREKAFRTLEKAMDSPAYTPTQRAAAKDIITLGMGTEATTDVRLGLVVNVATGLPPGLMAQQQTRERRKERRRDEEDVAEGEATPVE